MSGWWTIVILLCANLAMEVRMHEDCKSYPECSCERVTTATASDLIEDFCQEPKYAVPPDLTQFTVEPQSGVHSKGSRVVLYCNVSANDEPGFNEPKVFTWRHNGEVVAVSSAYNISSTPDFSALTITNFSAASQGEYYCHLENGNYSLVSRVANLQLPVQPDGDTWIDEAYSPQPNNSEIKLRVQNGSSAILECHLDTTSVYVHWTRDKKFLDFSSDVKSHYLLRNRSLLVRDIAGEDREYMCIISLAGRQKLRSFHISVEKAVAGEQLKFSVTPKNRTVVQGSNVSLYCVAEASTPPTIAWLKDGAPITANNSSALGATIVGGGEVLLLNAVAVEIGGNYTCVAASSQQLVSTTAYVTVYESAPPSSATIRVTGDHYVSHSDVFIPMNGNVINLTLSCSQYPQSAGRAFIEYNWAFRGELINDSAAVVFHPNGNTLLVIAADVDPWSIIGTYQCFVSNPTGSAQTSIRILPQGKLNPPSSLQVMRDPSHFQYNLSIQPSRQVGNATVNGYATEILIVKSEADVRKCVCRSGHEDGNTVRFFAGTSDYIQSNLYFKTAATNDDTGSTSDFALYGCPEGISVPVVTPPPPTGLRHEWRPAAGGHSWNVTLSWQLAEECEYPADLYSKCIQVDCDTTGDHDKHQVGGREYNLSLPCCTSCKWTVTAAYNGCSDENFSSQSSSDTFTTPSLPPTEPPVLNSVDRALSDGKSVKATFTLPSNNISCDPSSIIISYSNATYSNTVTAALNSDDATTKGITAFLSEAQCWREYNISIAYSNSAGNSTSSHPQALRGPVQDYVRGYTSVSIKDVSSTSITVGWQLEEGMECLISTGYISGELCCSEVEAETRGCSGNEQCRPAVTSSGSHTFSNLKPYQEYCFTASLLLHENGSVINSTSKIALTGESTPDCPPANLSVLLSTSPPKDVWIEWEPPPQECLNGVLKHYNVTITTTDGRPKTHFPEETKYSIPDYDSTLEYVVFVSACTSVGCGATATETIHRTSDPTTPTEHSTPSTSHDSNTVTVVAITVAGVIGLVIVFALVLVALVVKKKCSCGPCRKNREEEPFPNVVRDEPLRDDLPVSVTPHQAPSVSERTSCYALDRYLKEEYDLGLPDGSVDNNIHEEEDPQQNDLHKGLLDSSSVRDRIGEFNYPRRHDRQAEGVELESLPPNTEGDEGTEEDTCPLISSHKREQHPTAKPVTNRGAEKQRRKGKKATTKQLISISSSQTSATDGETIQNAAPLISSLPKRSLNSGYVTDTAAASTVHNVPPVLTSLIGREPPSLQTLDSTVSSHHSKSVMSNSQQNPIHNVLPTARLSSPPESPHEIPFSCDLNLTSFSLLAHHSPVGKKLCQQDSGYVQESTSNSSTGNHMTNCLSPSRTRQEYPLSSPSTFPPVSTYQSSFHSQGSTHTIEANRRHEEATTKKVNWQDSGYVQESTTSQGDSFRQLHSEDGLGLVFTEEFDDSRDGFNSTVNPEVTIQQHTGLTMGTNGQAISRQQYLSSHFELSTSTEVCVDSQNSSSSNSTKHSLASKALSHQDSGYVRGSMEESSQGLPSEDAFDFMVEEFDDAASDNSSHSSVFKEPQAVEGFEGHMTAFHPAASVLSNQRRTRRLLTSGVYSQSSESPEPVPNLSDMQRTSYITDTAVCTSDIDAALAFERRNSEGYFSEPPTPSSKKPMDFTLPQTSQAYLQGSVIRDSVSMPNTTKGNTSDCVLTANTAQSRPTVTFASGYCRESPEKASSGITGHLSPPNSTIGAPKTSVNTSPLSRQPPVPEIPTQISPRQKNLPQAPSMVTYLYDRSTSMPHSEGTSKCAVQAELPASTATGNSASPSKMSYKTALRDAAFSSGYVEATTPFTGGPNSRQESHNFIRDSHHLRISSKTEKSSSKATHTLVVDPLRLRNTISAPLDSASSSTSLIARPKTLNPASAIKPPWQTAGNVNTGYYTTCASTDLATPSRNSSGSASSTSELQSVLGAGNPGHSTSPTLSHQNSSNASQPTVANILPNSDPPEPKQTRYVLPSLLGTTSTSAIITPSPSREVKGATCAENQRSRTPSKVSKSPAAETSWPRDQLDLERGYASSHSASQESLGSSDDFPLLAMSEERHEVIERQVKSGYV